VARLADGPRATPADASDPPEEGAVADLEVELFGGFRLRRRGEPLPPVPSRVARSLFAYLLLHRDTAHSRERLAAQFWPDLPPSRARRRLSHTLWQIQDALAEASTDLDPVEVTPDTLAIRATATYTVDVEAFEQGLDRLRGRRDAGHGRARDLADLERIVDLYRGDVLAGHYEPWVIDEQQRLEQRYLEALSWLVELARSQGAFADALTYARRLTNQDPLREDAHREVMRLSTLLGRTSDALRQYERCREVLAEELGTNPSAATEQLHRRILRQRQHREVAPADPDPLPERLPLIGRADERTTAVGALERAMSGRGNAVLVEGEAGAGTTRFLSELVDDAQWRGFEVLRASARGPEPAAPYALVRQLLEGVATPLRVAQLRPHVPPVWLSVVAQVVPALGAALPAEHRAPPAVRPTEAAQRLRHAIEATLLALAELDPLLVVADDLQWADDASLAVLGGVATRLRDHRAVLLLGYRGEEARARPAVWGTVRELDAGAAALRIGLGPLDTFSIAELVRLVGGRRRLDRGLASRLRDETGGNPLFVVETLRMVAETVGDTSVEDVSLPLPPTIRDLVLTRLTPLSAEARTVLDLVAVGGAGTELAVVEDAAELPRDVVVDAAGDLVRRRLLVEVEGGFGLPHEQVRRVVLDALTEAASAALHGRVGAALRTHRPDATERLAHHFLAAGRRREAVVHLRRAGREAAAVHDYAAAARHLTHAVVEQRSRPASVRARFDLVAELEAVLDVLGDRDGQREAVEELLVTGAGDAVHEAEALRRRASLAAQVGALAEAEADARRALDLASGGHDPAEEARTRLTLGRVLALAGRRRDAIPVLRRAAASADLGVGSELEARTLLASVLRELQRYDEAVGELETALDLAEREGELREEAQALGVLGTVRMETGHAQEASELYTRAIERCRTIGFRRGEGIHLTNLGNVAYGRGRIAEALHAYAAAAEVVAHVGDERTEAAVRLNLGYVCHSVLGDDERASRELGLALRTFTRLGDVKFEAACRDARASIALRAGELAAAEDELTRALALPDIEEHVWTLCQLLGRRAEVRLAGGASADARELCARARALAERHDLGDLEVGLLALDGAAHLAAGDVGPAVTLTERAVEALHDGVERAHLVHLHHHAALAAAGEHERAAAAIARAAACLDELLEGLSEADRRRATAVPEHARIAAAHAAVAGVRTTVAAASAPRGRALREVEFTEVTVDLDPGREAPEDPVARRRHLLRRVADQITEQGGAATVGDLARLLEVSEATVRRDLAALRRAGADIATRGRRTS
jgi:DNA-binding SARP family transcriptional activator